MFTRSFTWARRRPCRVASLALAGLSLGTAVQGQDDTADAPAEPAPQQGDAYFRAPPYTGSLYDLGLALGNEAVWITFRSATELGHLNVELYVNTDDEVVASARLMRFGRPDPTLALDIGVGMGLYGVSVEKPSENAFAVALAGSAAYELDTRFPSSVVTDLAWAPNILTFGDGEGILDFSLHYQMTFSEAATVQLGWRSLEIETDDGGDRDLDAGFFIGVQIGL